MAFLTGMFSCSVPFYIPAIIYLALMISGMTLVWYYGGGNTKIIFVEKKIAQKSDRLEPPITDKYGKPWKRTTKIS